MGAAAEQLDLFKQSTPAKCPLWGCRRGCSCSPTKRAETARRLEALKEKAEPVAELAQAQGGPGDFPAGF